MKEGKVKFFNESKGFGFIVDNTSGEESFVHVTGLLEPIRQGEIVTYETEHGKKGINAINVKVV